MPRACTLPTDEQPLRRSEFDALFAHAVRQGERIDVRHLRITLGGGLDLEGVVRDLVARETECCSFFSFSVAAPQPGLVWLDIRVPAARVEVLDALEARVAAVPDTA